MKQDLHPNRKYCTTDGRRPLHFLVRHALDYHAYTLGMLDSSRIAYSLYFYPSCCLGMASLVLGAVVHIAWIILGFLAIAGGICCMVVAEKVLTRADATDKASSPSPSSLVLYVLPISLVVIILDVVLCACTLFVIIIMLLFVYDTIAITDTSIVRDVWECAALALLLVIVLIPCSLMVVFASKQLIVYYREVWSYSRFLPIQRKLMKSMGMPPAYTAPTVMVAVAHESGHAPHAEVRVRDTI